MKKLAIIGATILAALCAVVGVAPSANAYPDLSCNVTVNAQKVNSGAQLEVTATSQQFSTPRAHARAAADAVDWRAEFNGKVHTAHAVTFHTTFDVPTVKTEKVLTLHVRAVMPDATTTCEKSLNITVEPGSTTVSPPGGGHLPDTGGPRLLLLVGGLVLVAGGAVAIRQSRKGHDVPTH